VEYQDLIASWINPQVSPGPWYNFRNNI
jgi:hypothetical protein